MSDKHSKLLALFSLPPSTAPPLDTFHCAYLDANLPYQGTLYLFDSALAFHSSLVPLHPQKLVVPYSDISSLAPARLMGMNRSMAVRTNDKEYFFTSFLSRDKCVASIQQLVKGGGVARRRGGSREEEDEGREGGEGGDSAADDDYFDVAAERTAASQRRPKQLGVDDDDERSISFASEEDEADDDPTSGAARQKAAKPKSSRPNKANHRRALSTSYTVGERYAAAKDKDRSPRCDDGDGQMSKQEKLLARNAQRIREQKERAEKERVEAAEEELREERGKSRGAMMARLSPMNLMKTKEERQAEAAQRKRREDRQEWEHNTDSEAETPDGEQEKGGRKDKTTRLPIRLPRKRAEDDDDDNIPRGSSPSPTTAQQEESIEDESSPDYIPPQPSSLYMPRAYTLADPQVSAIAARFSSLSGPLDTKNRRYIADGPVQRQGRYSVVSRQMLLFSDKLILAKVKGGARLQMKQQCDLDAVTLDIRPVEQQRLEGRDTKLPDPFRVCFRDSKGKTGWWVLSAGEGGQERRRQWVKRIQLAVSRVLWVRWKESGRQFEWGWYMTLVVGSIHLAVRNNAEQEVRALLTREPQLVNERGQQGLSPLMVAAHVNHHHIASLLLEQAALPTYRDWDSRTAVHIAAKLGYADTLNVLLEDDRVECKMYHPGAGRFSTNSALWMAALSHRGDYDKCMRLLVQHCKTHKWPLASSSSSLLNQRDIEQHTLLETCVSLSLTDVIPVVLSLGASLDLIHPTLRTTPLCLAAQQTDLESLTTLIQLGAQPNWRDPKSGNAVLHHSSSLQVSSFLVAHGARLGMRNKDGTRITDIYAQNREVATLMAAEQLYQQRKPVETRQPVKGRPRSVSANGGHALESCYLCNDGVGGLGGVVMMKKVGWCARCGYVMCSACLSQSLIFLEDDGEALMRVCSGCYNVEMYAEETADRKKRRQERQRREAEEAKSSIFNLDYITSALTAVHISQRALPVGNVVSTYHGKVQIAELPAVVSSSPLSASAPIAPIDPLAAPVASRRSPQPSSAASGGSPPALRHQTSFVGPGANAALASVDRGVNYTTGGSFTPRGEPAGAVPPRKANRLAVNNETQPDSGGSGSKRAGGGLKVSASMDGVSDRMKKGNRSSPNTADGKGRGRSAKQRAEEEEEVEEEQGETEERTDDSYVVVSDEEHSPDGGRKGGKGKSAMAKKPTRAGGKEEKSVADKGEEEGEEARVVNRRVKAVIEVRVDDEEKRGRSAIGELGKKASKRRVVEDDFT